MKQSNYLFLLIFPTFENGNSEWFKLTHIPLLQPGVSGGGCGGCGASGQAQAPLGLEIVCVEIMFRRKPIWNRGPHLPNMVHALHLLHLQLRKEPKNAAGWLGAGVPDIESELRLDDIAVGADVEGLDVHGAVGFLVGEQGLGPLHADARRIDGPRDPAVGFGWSRDEGDWESRVGRVVGPVEVGFECGEVYAVWVELVVGEGLGAAGERMRGRD